MKTENSIWESAEAAVVAGDEAALDRLLREHDRMFREQRPKTAWLGGLAPDYSNAQARTIILREHCFASVEDLQQHLDALKRPDSPAAKFETAVDAIVSGHESVLRHLLSRDPSLVHVRSTRSHHATLLHYVGANGVESWRQRTPRNAGEMARILIEAGAGVNATADMYGGGSTALGLVATSVHPLVAGVQNELMDVLLELGAALDDPRGAGNGHSLVNGCLANGRFGAARHLAERGALLDLEGAAGVGCLEVVRGFVGENGCLKADSSLAQLKSGFNWACQYGRNQVVALLLPLGIKPDEIHRGATGLHWAAYGGHLDIVKRLLEHQASVGVQDERWMGTPLGWALAGWEHPPLEGGGGQYHEVVALLIGAGAVVDQKWIAGERVQADARMLAALRGQQ